MATIPTQLLGEKNDNFYPEGAARTTGQVTRVESNTEVRIKTENLYAHYVATCEIVQNGIQHVDGFNAQEGDIVLCVNQSDRTKNGVLIVKSTGDWTFAGDTIHAGIMCVVSYGTTQAGTAWVCQEPREPTAQGIEQSMWVRHGSAEIGFTGLWRRVCNLVGAATRKLLCLIEENKPYEVVMHYDGFSERYGGVRLIAHPLNFENVRYKPTKGEVTIGSVGGASGWYYTPEIDGFWDVDVFVEDSIQTPAGFVVTFYIESLSGVTLDFVKVCSATIQTGGKFEAQGSRKIWCAAGGKIYVTMIHNYNVPPYMLYLNDTLNDRNGYGYVSIHFAGKSPAATH